MRAPRLLLVLLSAALLATPASATTLYESDFSDYVNEWWPDIGFTQNAETTTFEQDAALGSTTSMEGVPIDTFDMAQITLDVVDASMDSDMLLAVSYWTASDVELGWGYIDAVTGAGSFGGLLSSASFLPPVGTAVYRVRLEMTDGSVEVDNVAITLVPEPDTAALLGFGLLLLTVARRQGVSV